MLSAFHLTHTYVVMTVISEEPGSSVLGCNMCVTRCISLFMGAQLGNLEWAYLLGL